MDEDEAVVPEDLSVCSEDVYEMDNPEELVSQKFIPPEIPGCGFVDWLMSRCASPGTERSV